MERTVDEAEYVLAVLQRMRGTVSANPELFDPNAQARIDEAIICVEGAHHDKGREWRIPDTLYSWKFIRRIKFWKRRSERKSSKQGSTFSSTIQFARCWYAVSSHLKVSSVSPRVA
jgi:hypothetical protein